MVKVLIMNPNYNPKPITEGEVWQGNPLFPDELRDDNEKLWKTLEVSVCPKCRGKEIRAIVDNGVTFECDDCDHQFKPKVNA